MDSTIYRKIESHLMEIIQQNANLPNYKLPSERMLSVTFGASRKPVRNAYENLIKKGYVENIHGKGYFIGQKAKEDALIPSSWNSPKISLITPSIVTQYSHDILSGALRIIRQYAWEENVHLTTDFTKGIRDNYRQTAAICCLAGLIYTLCILVYHSASAYQNSALSLFSLLPIGISAMVVLPVFAIALAMIPVYSNTLFQTLKNAFYVYCRSLLKVLLATVCCLLPWVPALGPNFYCHILGGLLGIVLTPFILLGWNLFCYNRFDTHINPQVCPELIGKGTFPADKNNIL